MKAVMRLFPLPPVESRHRVTQSAATWNCGTSRRRRHRRRAATIRSLW